MMRNAKPLLAWAEAQADKKIVSRILLQMLPHLQTLGLQLTADEIEALDELLLPEPTYLLLKQTAEALIAAENPESICRV
ncbi:MAG: hypothetical protein ABW101_15565 [Candidatus Thiodiazotropha sp.]